MALGGFLAASDRRYRMASRKRSKTVADTVATGSVNAAA